MNWVAQCPGLGVVVLHFLQIANRNTTIRHTSCSCHNATLPTKQVTLTVALHTIAIKQTHYRTDYTSTSKQCITLMSERHNTAITPLPLAFGGWLRAGALYHLDITAMPACLRLCSQCSAMFAYCEVANYLQRYVWGSSRFSPRRSERGYVQIEYSLTLRGLKLTNYLAGSNGFNLMSLKRSSNDC